MEERGSGEYGGSREGGGLGAGGGGQRISKPLRGLVFKNQVLKTKFLRSPTVRLWSYFHFFV